MNFPPVSTIADLETLDQDEVFAGYCEFQDGDPEPGPNRGRSYWHGWRNAAMDHRQIEQDEASRQLIHEIVATGYLKKVRAVVAQR